VFFILFFYIAAMDKKVKITSLQTNSTVLSTQLDFPGWACSWDCKDSNLFYCGLVNGSVLLFDVRNVAAPVATLRQPSAKPVMSLLSLSAEHFGVDGLLMGLASGVGLWVSPAEETPWTYHSFDGLAGVLCFWHDCCATFLFTGKYTTGSCVSVAAEETSGLCVASFRGSSAAPRLKHTGCVLLFVCSDKPFDCLTCRLFGGSTVFRVSHNAETAGIGANGVRQIDGPIAQSRLSRSCIVKHPRTPAPTFAVAAMEEPSIASPGLVYENEHCSFSASAHF
jgi:hypothetical protein